MEKLENWYGASKRFQKIANRYDSFIEIYWLATKKKDNLFLTMLFSSYLHEKG
jgi:hypothetical protein